MDADWVDVDWSLKWFPSEEQRQVSLSRLSFRPRRVEAGPVARLVDTFRGLLTNGGAHAAVFDVAGGDEVAAWCLSRNRDEYRLADCLVRSEGFADALPEVVGQGLTGETGFERSNSLVLDGTLARALQWGGAYSDSLPALPGAQAKAMGMAFCASVFGDRYDDVDVDHSAERWSRWFKGVAWDSTWVVTDKRWRQVTVLCLTDTD